MFALYLVGTVYSRISGKNYVINNFELKKPDLISRQIAKDLNISTDWTIFSLQPPIEIKKSEQHLRIFTEGYEKYAELEEHAKGIRKIDSTKIILADGTIINPKVQIIDEAGKSYDLKFMWTPYAIVFKEQLPKDKKYVKLKINSNKPFKAYLINWLDINERII